jgi:hypothetical protein
MWSVLCFLTRRAMWSAALGVVGLVLSACAASRPTPMGLTPTVPPPTAMATVTVPPSTAVVPSTPTAAAAAPDWTDFESRTPDGLYERGNPDAPVLIRDYSDFL